MGVFKLWELLLTVAQPYTIEQLSGKVLAIDASIWIVKIDTGLSSNTDKIKSILNKIMTLKRNNVLPLFVFDGVAPGIKRRTLEERNRKRLIANDMDAKKKTEIEVMRMIEGDSTSNRNSQRNKRAEQNESELEIVNEQLKKLQEFTSFNEEEVSAELLEKIAMQSQILNTKYKLMLDLVPEYRTYPHFIPFEEYQEMDLEMKVEYIDQLHEFKWKHLKISRRIGKERKNMTQEEKLRKDIQIIEKKSVIREMQDTLYRKTMLKNVKIENGYEIIQTIYNGKKVIQKRKVQEGMQQHNYGTGLRKDKMKNNFGAISFGEEKEEESAEEGDAFLKQFCNHSVNTSTQNQSISRRMQELKVEQSKEEEAKKQKKFKKARQKYKNASDSNNEDQQPYIPFRQRIKKQENPESFVNKEQFQKKYEHEQMEPMNRDNLPDFSSQQYSSYLNTSNDNVELQNLFKILGLPFLIAPGQAQAQCAALEREGIVDGIVTEDSDVFLFGGKQVYRGVFNNKIKYYNFDKMQDKLKLSREKLIIFAELLGSDYSEGVKGIGLVNAMEVLKVFNTFQKLQKFKNWAEHPDVFLPETQTTKELMKAAGSEQKQFYELHQKFKNYWYVKPNFGSRVVHEAYLHPDVVKVDQLKNMKEKGAFDQNAVKEELLSKLLKERLEMQDKEYEHYMRVLTLKYRKRQANLYDYFRPRDKEAEQTQLARIKSKRLQKSLEPS